eukprot:scaffold3971_cov417-Prasinococcus_capsulatus_cf.AAC.5
MLEQLLQQALLWQGPAGSSHWRYANVPGAKRRQDRRVVWLLHEMWHFLRPVRSEGAPGIILMFNDARYKSETS